MTNSLTPLHTPNGNQGSSRRQPTCSRLKAVINSSFPQHAQDCRRSLYRKSWSRCLSHPNNNAIIDETTSSLHTKAYCSLQAKPAAKVQDRLPAFETQPRFTDYSLLHEGAKWRKPGARPHHDQRRLRAWRQTEIGIFGNEDWHPRTDLILFEQRRQSARIETKRAL